MAVRVRILNTTISNDLGWERRYYVIPDGMDGVLLYNGVGAGSLFSVPQCFTPILSMDGRG